ncbi:hypothetical protein OF83DRAFT_641359 [Amylostereum chailletii]|nr:hypothetical protein OF83DRAFT_641359 [Amylostereum chailletii]
MSQSGPPSSVKRSLGACMNTTCEFHGKASDKAPLKCVKCKTARYCNKQCQREHWPSHKSFCQIWAETFTSNGQVPVSHIKLKMGQLIWLVRGLPEYTKYLFTEHEHYTSRGERGFIEFHFTRWEELYDAIKALEEQPITEEVQFCAMPGTPSYAGEIPGKGAVLQSLPLRKIRQGDEGRFMKAVDDYMHFTSNDSRPNLQIVLDRALKYKDQILVSVTVDLEDTHATHMYDSLYRRISWYPES